MQGLVSQYERGRLGESDIQLITQNSKNLADALIKHLDEYPVAQKCTIFIPDGVTTAAVCTFCGLPEWDHNN